MNDISDFRGFIHSKEGLLVVYSDNGRLMAGYVHTGDPREEPFAEPVMIYDKNGDGVYGYDKDTSVVIKAVDKDAETLYRLLKIAKAPFLSYRNSEDANTVNVRVFEKDENGNPKVETWVALGRIEKTM